MTRLPRPIRYEITESGCFVCISHHVQDGYPVHKKRGKVIRIHRQVYSDKFGPIPDGMVVRHKCDNPLCINVDHLELGTHADNVSDRVSRGRSAFGERHGRSKLSVDDVVCILKSAESTWVLAKRYGVDPKSIRQIIDRKTWKSVSVEKTTG